jgi:hypothetical protein
MAASIVVHDNQVFNSGIITVLDAIALGFSDSDEIRSKIIDRSIAAVVITIYIYFFSFSPSCTIRLPGMSFFCDFGFTALKIGQ